MSFSPTVSQYDNFQKNFLSWSHIWNETDKAKELLMHTTWTQALVKEFK